MTEAVWNPTPDGRYSIERRGQYHAGYSDGFHGYRRDAGDHSEHMREAYNTGYNDGAAVRSVVTC